MTEDTMKLAAKKGAFLSTQTVLYLGEPPADWNAEQRAKKIATRVGFDTMFAAAKKYKVKIPSAQIWLARRRSRRSNPRSCPMVCPGFRQPKS